MQSKLLRKYTSNQKIVKQPVQRPDRIKTAINALTLMLPKRLHVVSANVSINEK